MAPRRREGALPDLIRKNHQECLCPCHFLRSSLQCPLLGVGLTPLRRPFPAWGSWGPDTEVAALTPLTWRAYLAVLAWWTWWTWWTWRSATAVAVEVVGDGARRFGA